METENLYTKLTEPVRKLYEKEHTTLGRQRLTLLLFCYLPILFIGILANFLGMTDPSAPFFKYTHTLIISAAAVFFGLYCKSRVSIATCLSAFIFIGQTVISIEMIYCALNPTTYYIMLIMANMVLLTMNMFVSMAASMKTNMLALGVATLAIYIAASLLADNALMKSFIIIFIIAFIFASMIGVWMAKSVNKMKAENEQMKKEELELLHILRLKKDEVKAFVSLASEKKSHDGTKTLLKRLDKKTKHNLLANVEEYMRTRDTDLDTIAQVFPEFTPSEREICRLILQGQKLNNICMTLNKNESNISSQRANMRKKLGLKPSDNLQTVLQQRLDEAK